MGGCPSSPRQWRSCAGTVKLSQQRAKGSIWGWGTAFDSGFVYPNYSEDAPNSSQFQWRIIMFRIKMDIQEGRLVDPLKSGVKQSDIVWSSFRWHLEQGFIKTPVHNGSWYVHIIFSMWVNGGCLFPGLPIPWDNDLACISSTGAVAR